MVRWETHSKQNTLLKELESNCAHYGDQEYQLGEYEYSPAKLLIIFHMDEELYAVVQTCLTEHKMSSVFSTKWKLEYHDKQQTKPMYCIINTKSITQHCMMIPYSIDNPLFYQEIWTPERWADCFHITNGKKK